jgi:hypothetical protein
MDGSSRETEMAGIIDSHLRRELDKAGFSGLKEACWDTSHTQGSGMAAYGKLGREEALAAVERHGNEDVLRADVVALYDEGGRIEVGRYHDLPYDHYNSMKVEVVDGCSTSALAVFLEQVRDELGRTSRRLHRDAEQVDFASRNFDAMWSDSDGEYVGTVDEFETAAGLYVRVSCVSDLSYDPYEAGEPEADEADVREIIDGKVDFGRLEVEVFEGKTARNRSRGAGEIASVTEPLTWVANSVSSAIETAAECVADDWEADEATVDALVAALKARAAAKAAPSEDPDSGPGMR